VTSDLGTCILKFHGRFYIRIFQAVVHRIVEFIDIFSGILGYIAVMAHLIFIGVKNEFLLKS
jgi:hypothetical protein